MRDSNPFVNYVVTVAIFMVVSLFAMSLVMEGDAFSSFESNDMLLAMFVAGTILWFIGFGLMTYGGLTEGYNEHGHNKTDKKK